MSLRLEDVIWIAWVMMADEDELKVMLTNFRNAVLAFQEEELK